MMEALIDAVADMLAEVQDETVGDTIFPRKTRGTASFSG